MVALNDRDAKRLALETIVSELSRLQGRAKTADETFVAFLIASAQREAGARYAELLKTEGETV